MSNVGHSYSKVKRGLTDAELRDLAVRLAAALPPPGPEDQGEQKLLDLYRLMDGSRQAATLQYLSAMV